MNKILFFFELQKIFVKKFIFLFLIPFIAVLILLFIVNNSDEETKQILSMNIESEANSLSQALNNLPNIPETKNIKENLSNQVSLKERQLQAYTMSNWKEYLRLENEQSHLVLQGVESGNVVQNFTNEEIEQQIALNNEFIARNVEPLIFSENTKGWYFLKYIFDILYGITGIILVILFVGNILTKEKEQSTIKFLLAQSISKATIFSVKFRFSFIFAIVLIFSLNIFVFSSGTIMSGTGDLEYPILLLQETSYTIVSLLKYLILSTILFLSIILFTISLIFFLSVIIQNSMLVVSFVIIAYVIFGYVLPNQEVLYSLTHLIPFTYINVTDVVTGSLAITTKNFEINVINGVLTTLLSSIFLIISCIIIIKKRKAI